MLFLVFIVFVDCGLLCVFVVCCSLIVVRCSLLVVRCLFCVLCYLLFVVV